jgi:hypothetical protein
VVRRAGLARGADAETGIVTFVQRLGSALNFNVHLSLLVLDGAYTFEGAHPRFHRAPARSRTEIEHLLDTLIVRIMRALVCAGVRVEDPCEDFGQTYLDLDLDAREPLAQLQSAVVRYRIAARPIAGRKTLRLHTPGVASEATLSAAPKPFNACCAMASH